MKINLKKTNRAELTALREQLKAALEEQTNASAELTRLTERQAELQTEIIALENAADSECDEAAAKLSTKRVQLEQVSGKISQLSSVPAATEMESQGAILQLLRQFARAAAASTAPDIETYAGEIAAKIRAYCQDDATARLLSYQTPAAKFLMQTYARPFGSFGFSVNEIKAAIARADEILSGELSWSWDAKK
jgi:hypothetical protein